MRKVIFFIIAILLFAIPALAGSGGSPYSDSTAIPHVNWADTYDTAGEGTDNWILTWADDGNQYGAWGDGYGWQECASYTYGTGISKFTGTYDSYSVTDEQLHDSCTKTCSSNPYSTSGLPDEWTWGMLAYYDGTNDRIYGVFTDGDSGGHCRLKYSDDKGCTWSNASWDFSDGFFGKFGGATFLQMGQNYSANSDGYVYIYAREPCSGFNCYKDKIFLARAPKESTSILTQGNWKYWNGSGWSSDIADTDAVFTWTGKIGPIVTVSYDPDLGKYLLAFVTSASGFDWALFESANPTGPWYEVAVYDNFKGHSSYTWHWVSFAPKWYRNNGKGVTLIYGGQHNGTPDADQFHSREGAFTSDFCFSVDGDDNNTCACSIGEHCKTIEKFNQMYNNYAGADTRFLFKANDEWNYGSKATEFSNAGLSYEDDFLKLRKSGTGDTDRAKIGAFTGDGTYISGTYDWETDPSGYGNRPHFDGDDIDSHASVSAVVDGNTENPETGLRYITVENLWISNWLGEAGGSITPHGILFDNYWENAGTYYITVQNNLIHYMEGNGILVYRGGTHLGGQGVHLFSHNKILNNTLYHIDQEDIKARGCAFGGGAAIVSQSSQGGGVEMSGNTIYDCSAECLGNYYQYNTVNPNLVQGNKTWNCKSAHVHSTDSIALSRWNFQSTYDAGGDLKEPYWCSGYGGDTWPNCTSTEWSGFMPEYGIDNAWNIPNRKTLIGNLMHGQLRSITGGWSTGIALTWTTGSDDEFTVRVHNNTVVDSRRNISVTDDDLGRGDDGTDSYIRFNISSFYDTRTLSGENITGRTVCDAVDSQGRLISNYNNWYSSGQGYGPDSDCVGANDITTDPKLETTTDSSWRFPPDRTTITWKDFRLTKDSPGKDPANTAYIALVAPGDDCNGGVGCDATLEVDYVRAFWPGDYITVATRTNTVQVTDIDYSTGILTLASGIDRDDGDKVYLNPYKWADGVQDPNTGWYGNTADWGGIEYAGDQAPTLGDEPLEQDHTTAIDLVITARNPTVGVSDDHDWSDFIVCTNGGSLSDCLASIVWASYDETVTPLTTTIPGNTLSPNTEYWWTARTHNDWPYEGEWQSTLDAFSTSAAYGATMSATPLGSGLGATMQATPLGSGLGATMVE